MTDAIDRYLDSLRVQLGRREGDAARLVEEAEEHLRDTQEALIDSGWTVDAAADAAVHRFGGPDTVARRLPLVGGPVVRQVVVALAPVVAVAMVVAGFGGFVSLCLTWLVDHDWVGVADGTLWTQVFIGVAGLGMLETRWRRRAGRSARPSGLSARFVPAAGLVSFALAAAALAVYGLALAWWDRTHHMSRPLVTALACVGAAGFYGVQFVQGRVARGS